MLRLTEMCLSDEATEQFLKKYKVYNELHTDDKLTHQEFAKELLEIAIKFIDITAID